MRRSQFAAALVAICLCGASVRAQTATMASATAATATGAGAAATGPAFGAALHQVLSSGGLLSGVQPAAGVGATMRGSLESLKTAASASMDVLSTAYANAGAQAEAALAAFEQEYCTPATFTPSEKVPASFVGHSMAVTFSMGNCTFNESKWIHDDIKELECTEPSISYAKSPASFTSKYHSAPSFSSKECVVTKTFGEAVEKVLFVFDGTQAPDINALTTKITEEVKKMLGTVTSGVQDLVGNSKGLFAGGQAGLGGLGGFGVATGTQAGATVAARPPPRSTS